MVSEMLQILLLSCLLIDLSYATIGCHEVHQSHLASLHERMNHMLSTLYSSPLLTKNQESAKPEPSTAKPESTPAYETPCQQQYSAPAPVPPVIFIAPQVPPPPTPSYYGDAVRPIEYAYPPTTAPQPAWNYDQYYQQYYQPPPPIYPPAPYPYPPHPCETSYPYPPEYAPSYRPPYPHQPYALPYPPSPSPYLSSTYPRPNEMATRPQYA